MVTSQPSTQKNFQNLIFWLEDFHAKHFLLQESAKDLLTNEEISFLKSYELLNKQNLHIFSWKTSKGCSITTKGKRSPLSSNRLQNWGILSNGRCLTARVSVSHNTENESTLSDILEEYPDQKYFLSKQQTKKIIYHKDKKAYSQPYGLKRQQKQDMPLHL